MDQQVSCMNLLVVQLRPKPGDLAMNRQLGLIYGRRKALEWFVARGERLIKLGDGWFSTKAILVA